MVILAFAWGAFLVIFGVHLDEEVEKFLNSQGALERFNQSKGQKPAGSATETSPLVKQATRFALYLNPPPKPQVKRQQPGRSVPGVPARPKPKAVSVKFELIGTSYYASHPELSLALIDQPGKGLRWVRQSGELGHLVFEQIKDGAIVVKDGQSTYEVAVVERPKKINLLKTESADTEASDAIDSEAMAVPTDTLKVPESPPAKKPPTVSVPQVRQVTKQQKNLMENLAGQIKDINREDKSSTAGSRQLTEERKAMLNKLISDLRTMRVSDDEVRKLDRLGRQLRSETADSKSEPADNNKVPNVENPKAKTEK